MTASDLYARVDLIELIPEEFPGASKTLIEVIRLIIAKLNKLGHLPEKIYTLKNGNIQFEWNDNWQSVIFEELDDELIFRIIDLRVPGDLHVDEIGKISETCKYIAAILTENETMKIKK